MKTRSISDDDQCGGCKYRIMGDTPDAGDRCVHDFTGVTEEDEDGTIKDCHDFERPKRVLIVGGGPTSAAAVTALASAGFDIAMVDESTMTKAPPRLGMTRPKWGTSDWCQARARATLDEHYSAENHRRIVAALDAATERMTGMRPEHGMPYINPFAPQPMKPKPGKVKAHAKKRARIAAQSRRRNRR